MNNIIETKMLDFSYSKGKILDKLNLNVPEKSIYCFLGPNGAGKTTTIKLLLSLLQRNEANIEIFGKSLKSHRIEILRRVGAVIENPSLYGHLNGRENLMLFAKMIGVSKSRVSEVMEITQINYAAEKKLRKYSLGMKQRLEIARALLNDPDLLILDEPTNGLDPQGIKEMREFIIKLNQNYGKTIFISSHLLDEVQKMATHVGIINKGKLLFQGSLKELNGNGNHDFSIKTSDNSLAAKIIEGEGFNTSKINDSILIKINHKDDIAALNRILVKNMVDVYELSQQQTELEKSFFEITNN